MKKIYICLILMLSLSCGANELSWEACKRKTLLFQPSLPGWCSKEKATKMMNLIYDSHPAVCVEIGVFGGSSVYPTAIALNYLKSGIIYAIDPWIKDECTKGYEEGDPNYNWWSMLDLEAIYRDFKKLISSHKLESHCKIMRMTSAQALSHFKDNSIDILHIDGNHSEESALSDIKMYFPKVKAGGYIWFDDADWDSTNQATAFLFDHSTFDMDHSVGNSCLLFRKE
jgi:predicted O-methyltransferase YrrM